MNHRRELESSIARLRAIPGATIDKCRIGAPVSADDLNVVEMLHGGKPVIEIANLYKQLNGAEVEWSLESAKHPVLTGTINFLPIRQAYLGWTIVRGGKPFEGVLWNSEYSDESIKLLKTMGVLESIAGEPSFLTFRKHENSAALLYVYEEDVSPIQASFDEAVSCIFRYVGCEGLREHLLRENWQELIAEDAALARIRRAPAPRI
jgi:hypothetical protein